MVSVKPARSSSPVIWSGVNRNSTGGTELAVDAARHYRLLRARGRTVHKTIDCLIASFCLRERHSLLHCDRDFDVFEEVLGLPVVHP